MSTYLTATLSDLVREREAMTDSSTGFDEFYRLEFPSMVALASSLVGCSAEDTPTEDPGTIEASVLVEELAFVR